eukprot:281776_1
MHPNISPIVQHLKRIHSMRLKSRTLSTEPSKKREKRVEFTVSLDQFKSTLDAIFTALYDAKNNYKDLKVGSRTLPEWYYYINDQLESKHIRENAKANKGQQLIAKKDVPGLTRKRKREEIKETDEDPTEVYS